MECNCAQYVPLFKALADETRLKILEMLARGELCACDILAEFNITQPTLSYHMKTLCESGIISCRREGAWMHYSINRDAVEKIEEFFRLVKDTMQMKTSCCMETAGKCECE